MSLPKVCVLILNYQSYKDTVKYVELLQKQKKIELSILVVDNDSPNDSFTFLQNSLHSYENITVIKSDRNGGYAYGNNYGLRYLKNKEIDYILISNNDIYIDDDFLILKMIKEYRILNHPAFLSPIMMNNGMPSDIFAWKIPTIKDDIINTLQILNYLIGTKNKYFFTNKVSTEKVDCLPGSFFIGSKNIFYDIGLFDEATFLYGEERILAYKIKEKKLHNYIVQSLYYEHYTSKTISSEFQLTNMRKYLFDSRYYFHSKYNNESKVKLLLFKLVYNISILETKLIIYIRKFK